jgi:hypothetical protein
MPTSHLSDEHTLTLNDPPAWLNNLMKDCVGERVIAAYCGVGTNSQQPREIFLRVNKLFAPPRRNSRVSSSKYFHKTLKTLLMDRVPASLTNIVYVDDPESKLLANRVFQHFRSVSSGRICMVSAEQLYKAMKPSFPPPLQRDGVTMAVAGTLVVGKKLVDINIALRKLRCQRVCYLIGITRTSSLEKLATIRSTLLGGDPQSIRFSSVLDVFVPDDLPPHCPWDRELETPQEVSREAMTQEATRILNRRINLLQRAKHYHGLYDNLFWNGITRDVPLKLTPNFRLWKCPSSYASQADVYFTILATLHHLRSKPHPEPLILAPDSFMRLNDAVLQAALLRASVGSELDYRHRPRQSAEMRNLLSSIFQNHKDERGEACIEVLLAMLEERLQLTDRDTAALVNRLMSSLKARHVFTVLLSSFATGSWRNFREKEHKVCGLDKLTG